MDFRLVLTYDPPSRVLHQVRYPQNPVANPEKCFVIGKKYIFMNSQVKMFFDLEIIVENGLVLVLKTGPVLCRSLPMRSSFRGVFLITGLNGMLECKCFHKNCGSI